MIPMLKDTERLERRVACLEGELVGLREQNVRLDGIITSIAEMIESHAQLLITSAGPDKVIVARGLQIIDDDGRVAIMLSVGPNGEPLVQLVRRDSSGEIRHIAENALFPKDTKKGVNDV